MTKTLRLLAAVPVLSIVFAGNTVGGGYGNSPDIGFETVNGEGDARLRVLVFETTPGVVYRVRCSEDLLTWDEEITHYGLGNELVVPMCELEPPASPPPGGGGQNPSVFVSLTMQPAEPPATGVVMS